MILGGIMESNLRRSLLISQDGLIIFFERPICTTILAIDALLFLSIAYSTFKLSRRTDRHGKDPVPKGRDLPPIALDRTVLNGHSCACSFGPPYGNR